MKQNLLLLYIVCISSLGYSQEIYRGFNMNSVAATPANLDTLKFTKARMIRLSFGYSPLMDKNPPFGWNTAQFKRLNDVIDWAAANNMKVMIDPHTTPGTRDKYTIYPTDSFWTDPQFFPHLVRLWDTLAVITKSRGAEIYGLDLLNEPALPCCDADIWNRMVDTLVRRIRQRGNMLPIVIEPTARIDEQGRYITRLNNIGQLRLPNYPNLIVSAHLYAPNAFTHQGIGGNPTGIHYPGTINGVFYDSTVISSRLDSVRKFAAKHPGLRINIGEFSATRLAGTDGDRYVQDLVETFEKEQWDWNYHEYRGSVHWDAEMAVGSIDPVKRDSTTPRMLMLKSYFALGTGPLAIKSLHFSGRNQQHEFYIEWQVETDAPVTRIELQRSWDGRHFTPVLHQTPSPDERFFTGSYTHKASGSDVRYYRLLTEELSGSITYSGIIAFLAADSGLKIFPSVTVDQAYIEATGTSAMPVLFDLQGKKMSIPVRAVDDGYEIDLSGLHPGMYVVRLGLLQAKVIRL